MSFAVAAPMVCSCFPLERPIEAQKPLKLIIMRGVAATILVNSPEEFSALALLPPSTLCVCLLALSLLHDLTAELSSPLLHNH